MDLRHNMIPIDDFSKLKKRNNNRAQESIWQETEMQERESLGVAEI